MLKVFEIRLRELRNQIDTMNRILREYPYDVLERKRMRKQYFADCVYCFELEHRLMLYLDNTDLQADDREAAKGCLKRLYAVLERRIEEIHNAPCDLSDGARELSQIFTQSECDMALAMLER